MISMDADKAANEIIRISRSSSSRQVYFFNSLSINDYYALSDRVLGSVDIVKVSSYCNTKDSLPDMIKLMSDLKNRKAPVILKGLDQYLIHKPKTDKLAYYRQLAALPSSYGPLFILSFNSQDVLSTIAENDQRVSDRIFKVGESTYFEPWHLLIFVSSINYNKKITKGFRAYLEDLEKGPLYPEYKVSTLHEFTNAEIPVTVINSYKSLVHFKNGSGTLFIDSVDEEVWQNYLNDPCSDESLNSVYHSHFNNKPLLETLQSLSSPYDWWLFVSYHKNNQNRLKYPYLAHVADKSESVEGFRNKLVFGLMDYHTSDPQYTEVYNERKRYLIFQKAKHINEYCARVRSQIKGLDAVYYFTDITEREKESILDAIVDYGSIDRSLINCLKFVYKDLFFYLSDYRFEPEDIRDYFGSYRRYKLLNAPPSPEFISFVDENAINPQYYKFSPRDAVFNEKRDPNDKIYFFDALGIEYIPYIERLCEQYELDFQYDVCRASLPTTTSQNTTVLKELKFESNKDLDELAHDEKNTDEYYGTNHYIARQLEIIHKAVKHIHDSLKGNERYVLFSDHGLSRLYVLNGQNEELRWNVEADHNGRCAKVNDANYYDSNVKIESGYYVVSNYSRIHNVSHKAKIEAHGGATLEEVLVPLGFISIAGTLFKDCTIPEEATLNPMTGMVHVEIYYPTDTNNLYLFIESRRYESTRKVNNYIFDLDGLQIGTYSISVYDGNHHLKDSSLKVVGKGMKSKSLFSKLR